MLTITLFHWLRLNSECTVVIPDFLRIMIPFFRTDVWYENMYFRYDLTFHVRGCKHQKNYIASWLALEPEDQFCYLGFV